MPNRNAHAQLNIKRIFQPSTQLASFFLDQSLLSSNVTRLPSPLFLLHLHTYTHTPLYGYEFTLKNVLIDSQERRSWPGSSLCIASSPLSLSLSTFSFESTADKLTDSSSLQSLNFCKFLFCIFRSLVMLFLLIYEDPFRF